jgi:hypothetical protein
MDRIQINRIAALAPIVMSTAAVALLAVVLVTGWERNLKDEGAAAHTWQLLVGLQLPLILLFLASADWSRPKWPLLILAAQVGGLVLAMAPVAYFRL